MGLEEFSALRVALTHESVPVDPVVGGTPTTGFTAIATFGDLTVGVWETIRKVYVTEMQIVQMQIVQMQIA